MENAQLIKALYESFAQGDVPAVLSRFDDNIVWHEAEGTPYGGVYTGADAIVQNVFMKLATEWDGYTVTPLEFHDAGPTIIATGEYSGKYRKTGKDMRVPFAHLWTLKDGRVNRFVQFTDTLVFCKALEA